MSERKKLKASDIEALITDGFSEEQICEKLGLSATYYKEARKIFGITMKHRKSVKQEFDLVDDREPKEAPVSNLAQGLATAMANTHSSVSNVPNEPVQA